MYIYIYMVAQSLSFRNSESHHPAQLWSFGDYGAVYRCHNLLTYLFRPFANCVVSRTFLNVKLIPTNSKTW